MALLEYLRRTGSRKIEPAGESKSQPSVTCVVEDGRGGSEIDLPQGDQEGEDWDWGVDTGSANLALNC